MLRFILLQAINQIPTIHCATVLGLLLMVNCTYVTGSWSGNLNNTRSVDQSTVCDIWVSATHITNNPPLRKNTAYLYYYCYVNIENTCNI